MGATGGSGFCPECGYDRLDPANYDAESPRKCPKCGISLLPARATYGDDFVESFVNEVAAALKYYGVPDVHRVARPIVAAIIAAYSDPSDGRRAALAALRDYDDSVIE